MATGDDDLERRIRNVLRGRRLDVPVAPDAIDRVHAGARRRQQRHSGLAVLGAVTAIGVVAGGIALRPHGHPSIVAANPHTASPSTSELVSSPPPSASASQVALPSTLASDVVVAPTGAPVASTPPVQVFNPVSVSAVGVNDYWVLGYITADSGPDGIAIMKTTDAGQHFTKVGSPSAFVAQMNAKVPPGTPIVSDIRFGDTNNGWAYGGSLFATTDGGATWSAVTGLPGSVIDLAAVHGTAWAVVQSTTSDSVLVTYTLYRDDYAGTGNARGWRPASLAVQPAGNAPSLAVQGSSAYLLADGGIDGVPDDFYTIPVAGAITHRTGPCTTNLPARLSAGASAEVLWAMCASGTQASVHVSSDSGHTWTSVPASTSGLAIGGISARTAILGPDTGPLERLHSDGATSFASDPAGDVDTFGFVGFTTPNIGFAMANLSVGSPQLWRTTDGGLHWAAVTF